LQKTSYKNKSDFMFAFPTNCRFVVSLRNLENGIKRITVKELFG